MQEERNMHADANGKREHYWEKGIQRWKIITDGSKPVLQKRMELWGFQPLASPWSHLGLKQRGFVGTEDEQKSHFPSWLHLPLRIYMAVVLKSGRQMWSNMKGNGDWETQCNRNGERTKKKKRKRGRWEARGKNIVRWYEKGNRRESSGRRCDRVKLTAVNWNVGRLIKV